MHNLQAIQDPDDDTTALYALHAGKEGWAKFAMSRALQPIAGISLNRA